MTTPGVPARSIGWCAWHRGLADDPVLIQVVEQASGPGSAGRLYACPRCRDSYQLTPYAEKR
ncbi:hypothetical protein [Streptomyces sp. GZWMJZ-114]|uniref:hypothetical protein n=1 Tax=Streptomyces sp. GZWMJZ-114 TaxID=2494734 RepID=UPI001011CBCB|nr:hypothetical protein [Streptomyces sp. GZWMJZ-114]